MKIRQTKGIHLIAEDSRHSLEATPFMNLEHARMQIQSLFPYHLVRKDQGKILVELKDRSFQVAAFQEVQDSPLNAFRRR